MLKLRKFQVLNFRSVVDSGWISMEDVLALIGTNEAGKTNLLLPLWKLNPAKGGKIDFIADYPRRKYNDFRGMKPKPVFIRAQFELDEETQAAVVALTGATSNEVAIAEVSRNYDGVYTIRFPEAGPPRQTNKKSISDLLSAGLTEIDVISAAKGEETLKVDMLAAIAEARTTCELYADASDDGCAIASDDAEMISGDAVSAIAEKLKLLDLSGASKKSSIAPRFSRVIDELEALLPALRRPHPNTNAEARKAVLNALPKFVYYSNYGNLDSEIYLPHVIQNLARTDLGPKEEGKSRTLKVLFEFVKLSPKEIHELGKELAATPGAPTLNEIVLTAEKKKERDILLQAASTDLTQKFRDWWKQGNYRFRFQADGDHFRIWVSDEKRPEDIELEGRSSGLQWFLSFYLVFLVESADAHDGAVLLLDEPGLTLHALAQKDLSLFFDNLSSSNQLVYTTHSPFLVDANHLDRVRAVYVDDAGATSVSSDLRAGPNRVGETKSIYPVHAALGMTLSETLLLGARPVLVEGVSDQRILSGIKNYLIGAGRFAPKRELLFLPSGGSKGITAVVPIISGKDEEPPWVVVDADGPGKDLAKRLADGIYQGHRNRILSVGDFVSVASAEIEDIIPLDLMAEIATRFFRGPQEDFADVVQPGKAIIGQIEDYAKTYNLPLAPGWKVELSDLVKKRLLKSPAVPEEFIAAWVKLFQNFSE